MKILVVTVGTGRDRKDVAKAIAFSISRMTPDRVLLFTSEKTQEETYPFVIEFLDESYKTRCVAEKFPNEDDVQYLFTAYVERMRRELRENTTDNGVPTLWVDFTFGTKAMTAAVFAAGIALSAKEVCYVVGERDTTGRVMEAENVKRIEPQLVLAERDIAEARELFNQQDYAAAAHAVSHVKKLFDKGTHLGNLGNIIFGLGQAYAEWNLFNWGQAAKLLKENMKVFRREPGIVDSGFLERQMEFCNRLDQGEYDVARLVDLYASAHRCFREKRYDDAVARIYRAFEYSVQIRLKSEFQIVSSNFQLHKFERRLCEKTVEKFEKQPGTIKIDLRNGIELLAELGDPIGKELVNDYWNNWSPGMDFSTGNTGPLQGRLKARNDSYLAHGTKPIERAVAEELMKKFEKFLQNILKDEFGGLIFLATFCKI